jgi:hypothetical protein
VRSSKSLNDEENGVRSFLGTTCALSRIQGTCEDPSGVFLRCNRIRGEGGLEFHPADRTSTRVSVMMLGVHGTDVNQSLAGRGRGFLLRSGTLHAEDGEKDRKKDHNPSQSDLHFFLTSVKIKI